MIKLLNLTIKIDHKDRYKNAGSNGIVYFNPPRIIEPTNLEIKDQEGNTITELKKSRMFGNFQVGDIKNINLSASVLDIPVAWAWKKKGVDSEIEFTLKKLKYDENQGLRFGAIGTVAAGTPVTMDTLFLNDNDFEGIEVFKSKIEGNISRPSQIIELSDRFPAEVKQTWRDFSDLR